MKFVFATLFIIGILVTTCSSYCYRMMLEGDNPIGCVYKGELHEFNSMWRTEDCHRCECDSDGIECCSLLGTSVTFDKKKCFVVHDKKTCTTSVLQKKNPTKSCESYAMSG